MACINLQMPKLRKHKFLIVANMSVTLAHIPFKLPIRWLGGPRSTVMIVIGKTTTITTGP